MNTEQENKSKHIAIVVASLIGGVIFFFLQKGSLVWGGIDFAQALMMGCLGGGVYSVLALFGVNVSGRKRGDT